jgi:hypothetical protein
MAIHGLADASFLYATVYCILVYCLIASQFCSQTASRWIHMLQTLVFPSCDFSLDLLLQGKRKALLNILDQCSVFLTVKPFTQELTAHHLTVEFEKILNCHDNIDVDEFNKDPLYMRCVSEVVVKCSSSSDWAAV